MNTRLCHDAAFSASLALLEIVGLALPPEHQKDVFDEFYRVCRAMIEAYEIQNERMERRLNPSGN